MTDIVDQIVAATPALRFTFVTKAGVAPIQDLGQTARGHGRIVATLGGETHGPRLIGESLPGDADWQIVRAGDTIEAVAHNTIRRSAEALIYVQNEGPRAASPETAARAPDRIGIGLLEVLQGRRIRHRRIQRRLR
jgi:hypothetical protein